MATAATSNANPRGILAYNASQVGILQSVLSNLEGGIGTLPDVLLAIHEGNCWREFKFPYSDVVRWNAVDFRRFIEEPRPRGCETPIHVMEQALRPKPGDVEAAKADDVVRAKIAAWEAFQELTRGKSGAAPGDTRNPTGNNQWINRDVITVNPGDSETRGLARSADGWCDPTIIGTLPVSPAISQGNPRKRDYSREAPTGTSTSYTLRCLERGRAGKPARPDLLAKVKAGAMTPWAAAVEAGFIRPKVTLGADPIAAARAILRRITGDALLMLIRELAYHAGEKLLPLLRELADRLGYDLVERI